MDIQDDADRPCGRAGREPPCTGTPRRVCEALADPIVQSLMRADRIEAKDVASLMRRIAARLTRTGALRDRRNSPARRDPGRIAMPPCCNHFAQNRRGWPKGVKS